MTDVLVFLGALTLMAAIGLGVGVPASMLTLWCMNRWERHRLTCQYLRAPEKYDVPVWLGTMPNWPTLDARGELREAKLRNRED